jgi:hypothetical protein
MFRSVYRNMEELIDLMIFDHNAKLTMLVEEDGATVTVERAKESATFTDCMLDGAIRQAAESLGISMEVPHT